MVVVLLVTMVLVVVVVVVMLMVVVVVVVVVVIVCEEKQKRVRWQPFDRDPVPRWYLLTRTHVQPCLFGLSESRNATGSNVTIARIPDRRPVRSISAGQPTLPGPAAGQKKPRTREPE